MKHLESDLQKACIKWFRLMIPSMAKLLIAVPNGGFRNVREASRLKSEGVVSGVSDLLLLVPKNGFGCLGIEMKIGGGKQTENQKEWQNTFEKNGNKYEVCYSIDEFINIITGYLN